MRARIGDPDSMVTGVQTYVLRYTIRGALDHHDDRTELYWGATGTESEVPIERANRAFKTFMVSLTAVFVFIFIALNLMLWYLVIRPVTKLSRLADQVSQGENMDAPDFEVKSGDEIGVLTQSFNRMKKSLVQAMKMLEQ